MSKIPITYDGIDQACSLILSNAADDDEISYHDFVFLTKNIEFLSNYAKEDLQLGSTNGYEIICSLLDDTETHKILVKYKEKDKKSKNR